MKTAVVIGATGLVGGILLEKLALEAGFGQVLAIARRRPEASAGQATHPKVRWLQFDFNKWGDLELQIRSFAGNTSPVFFCALGTTISKAKSEEAFKRVDFEYVVEFAKLAQKCRAESLFVVSALGADSQSGVFYNRIKGQAEHGVQTEYFGKTHFMRPSLLLGNREEFRFGERIAVMLTPLISPLMLGPLEKFKPISADDVAQAMINIALKRAGSSTIVNNDEIYKISKSSR